VLILNRDDGVYGVTWLPDEGYGPSEHTHTNRDSMLPGAFPQEYDTGKLLAFAYRHYDV
jgi:hypothetical protein